MPTSGRVRTNSAPPVAIAVTRTRGNVFGVDQKIDRPRNQLDRRPQARKETDPGASTPDDPSPSKHPGKADTCVPERDTVRETTHESETKQDNRKFERADASELRPEDRVETRDEYPHVQG